MHETVDILRCLLLLLLLLLEYMNELLLSIEEHLTRLVFFGVGSAAAELLLPFALLLLLLVLLGDAADEDVDDADEDEEAHELAAAMFPIDFADSHVARLDCCCCCCLATVAAAVLPVSEPISVLAMLLVDRDMFDLSSLRSMILCACESFALLAVLALLSMVEWREALFWLDATFGETGDASCCCGTIELLLVDAADELESCPRPLSEVVSVAAAAGAETATLCASA